jgi:hypothetical protein
VGRSATGLQAAVNIRAIKDSESVTVILAQAFLKIRLIDVESNADIAIVVFNRIVVGTAVIK